MAQRTTNPSVSVVRRYKSIFLDATKKFPCAPFLAVSILYAASLVSSPDEVPPLYASLSGEHDDASLLVWRYLVAFAVCLPLSSGARQPPRERAARCGLVAVALVLGTNTYAVFDAEYPPWMRTLYVLAVTALAGSLSRGAHARPRASLALFGVIVATSIAHATLARAAWSQALCLLVEAGWLAAVLPPAEVGELRRAALVAVLALGFSLVAVAISIGVVAGQASSARTTNFAGMPICPSGYPVLYPTSLTPELVRDAPIWPVGSRHSWSESVCPKMGRLAHLSTRRMRRIRRLSSEVYEIDPGVTIGELGNRALLDGRALTSKWWGDITVAGAVANGVHNEGLTVLHSMVDNLTLFTYSGEVRLVIPAEFGSIHRSSGRAGVIAALRVRTIPLTEVRPQSETYPISRLAAAVDDFRRDTRAEMNLYGDAARVTRYVRGGAIEGGDPEPEPFRGAATFAHPRVAFEFLGTAMHMAYVMLRPLLLLGLDSLSLGEGNASYSSAYRTSSDVSSTLFSSTQINMVVRAERALACAASIATVRVILQTHVRHAPLVDHPASVHFDFSLPVWLLPAARSELERIERACAPHDAHNGKMPLERAIGR